VASRVSLKRLLPIFLVVLVAGLVMVPGAAADDFADAPCFDAAGPDTATCPPGSVGSPYSLQLLLAEGSGCGPGLTTWTNSSGSLPPGLSLGSGDGVISGTPTKAGNFEFFVTVSYPVLTDPPCNGGFSDKRYTIPINPGVPQLPKLTIGPEQSGVTTGTVGSAYSLQMTANLADAKTWAIVAGQLPAGIAINGSTGLISGTPTTAGTYSFTVQATIDAQRADTKSLAIVVRAPLAITAPGRLFNGTRTARTEVGLAFLAGFEATGGLGPYVWTQGGTLPSGIEFDVTDGSLTGEFEEDGTFRFTISVADAESRTISYAGTIVVAERLAIVTRRLKKGRVGRLYRSKLVSTGGVTPISWRIKRGPLPKGIRFDRTTGRFVGTPAKAGIWIITVELVDALRVKATTNVVVVVAPKPKPKR
jgi:large repetitive protein